MKRIRTFPGHEWEFISQALREIQAELESKVVSVEPKTVAIQRLGHKTFLETCFLSFSYLQLTFRKSSCYLDVKLVSKRFDVVFFFSSSDLYIKSLILGCLACTVNVEIAQALCPQVLLSYSLSSSVHRPGKTQCGYNLDSRAVVELVHNDSLLAYFRISPKRLTNSKLIATLTESSKKCMKDI